MGAEGAQRTFGNQNVYDQRVHVGQTAVRFQSFRKISSVTVI